MNDCTTAAWWGWVTGIAFNLAGIGVAVVLVIAIFRMRKRDKVIVENQDRNEREFCEKLADRFEAHLRRLNEDRLRQMESRDQSIAERNRVL